MANHRAVEGHKTIDDVLHMREDLLVEAVTTLAEFAEVPASYFKTLDDSVMALMGSHGYSPVFSAQRIENLPMMRDRDDVFALKGFSVAQDGNGGRSPQLAYDLAERAYRLTRKFVKIMKDPEVEEKIEFTAIVPVLEAVKYASSPKAKQIMDSISKAISDVEDTGKQYLGLLGHFMQNIVPVMQAEFAPKYAKLEQLKPDHAVYRKHKALLDEAYGNSMSGMADYAETISSRHSRKTEGKERMGILTKALDAHWQGLKEGMGGLSKTIDLNDSATLTTMSIQGLEEAYGIPLGLRWNGKRGSPYGKISVIVSPNGADVREILFRIDKGDLKKISPLMNQIGTAVAHIGVQPYAGYREGTAYAIRTIERLK